MAKELTLSFTFFSINKYRKYSLGLNLLDSLPFLNSIGYNLPLAALMEPVDYEQNMVFRNKNIANIDWLKYATNIFPLKPYRFLVDAMTKYNLIPPSKIVKSLFLPVVECIHFIC